MAPAVSGKQNAGVRSLDGSDSAPPALPIYYRLLIGGPAAEPQFAPPASPSNYFVSNVKPIENALSDSEFVTVDPFGAPNSGPVPLFSNAL